MTSSVRRLLRWLIEPTCTRLAVAVAFIGGCIAGTWSDSPWIVAVAAGLGVVYAVLLDALRWVVKHRRETA